MARPHHVRRAALATGITVPFVEQGDPQGRCLVLLHPWVEALGCFDVVRGLLPAQLRVLAFDQRGHGAASKPADGYSLASFAADVVAFLDALDVPSAILVGSSSGGYVAQQVAVDSPERVAGLVLIGAPLSLHGRPAFADEVDALIDPLDPRWVAESLTWFPMFHAAPAKYLADRVSDALAAPAHVWQQTLAGLTQAAPPTAVGRIGVPALILAGGRDDVLGHEQAEGLAAAIPGAELVVYEDTGHLVLWEQPQRVAADIIGFVGRHYPA